MTHKSHVFNHSIKFQHSIIIYESLVTRDSSNKQQNSKGKRKIREQWCRSYNMFPSLQKHDLRVA